MAADVSWIYPTVAACISAFISWLTRKNTKEISKIVNGTHHELKIRAAEYAERAAEAAFRAAEASERSAKMAKELATVKIENIKLKHENENLKERK